MERYYAVAVVTLLCSFMIFGMALKVAKTHSTTGILAPTMTGDPRLERAVRAHANTLEWLPIFLPALWLFAIYWSPVWAGSGSRLDHRPHCLFRRIFGRPDEAVSGVLHPVDRSLPAALWRARPNSLSQACLNHIK